MAVSLMRTIFLLDIDCFFASVEMALHPELRGKPLCVGGRRGERGIVACPNYEARAYGVKTAMPLRTAEHLLPPDAVFVPGSHRLYGEYSERVMDILYDFTPDIEQVSIDEAYMDVTGCLHFWGHDPARMALAMKERIMKECGLSVSIGVASNKVCAKIAACLNKPDGLVVVPHGGEKEFLAPLAIEMVPGVGVKTAPKLHALGIRTVADILNSQSLTSRSVNRWADHSLKVGYGSQQSYVWRYLTAVANGVGDQVIQHARVEKSISRDTTFWHDTADTGFIASTLYYLTERCCKTLRKRSQVAGEVNVKVRFADFTTVQKQMMLNSLTANEEDLFTAARKLLRHLLPAGRMIRLVGIRVARLLPAERAQMQLNITETERRENLHHRLDALQQKFGYTSIQWGITHMLQARFESSKEGYRLHSPVYEL
jgi:DNA polymerase-4